MQKIIIKNFGPVKDAEIEIKKVLVLIGEQASGKSTIAKLIYFFKSLRKDLANLAFDLESDNVDIDIDSNFLYSIRANFYAFFGSTLHLPDFKIVFYYSLEKNKYLQLSLDASKELNSEFSVDFLNEDFKFTFKEYIKNIRNSNMINEGIGKRSYYDQKQIMKLLNEVFEFNQTSSLFVIAGRNATVGYSDLFEKYLFASVKNTLEENLNQPFDRKKQNIDEALMLYFIERVSRLKSFYQKSGGLPILVPMWIGDSKPEEILKNNDANNKTKQVAENFLQKREERQQFLTRVITLINKILKGEYHFDNDGEKIILNNREKIHLHNASSGQQEVIRILQDIFMIFLEESKVLRIIEEPEAHLFPVAQKQLIELLALMVNYQPENQLIITTHSPYILTVFNHLLFSSRVVAKNPAAEEEVKEIVDKDCWLDPNEFSAYSLGNESFPEDNAKYCESIFDQEKGMLQQNYLDTVSEILGWEFSKLYSVHGKTFKRR